MEEGMVKAWGHAAVMWAPTCSLGAFAWLRMSGWTSKRNYKNVLSYHNPHELALCEALAQQNKLFTLSRSTRTSTEAETV